MTTKHDNEVIVRGIVERTYSEGKVWIDYYIIEAVISSEDGNRKYTELLKRFYNERYEKLRASAPSSDIKKAAETLMEAARTYAANKHFYNTGYGVVLPWKMAICHVYKSTSGVCSRYCPAKVCYGDCSYLAFSMDLQGLADFIDKLDECRSKYDLTGESFLFTAQQYIQSVGKSE